MYTNNKKCITFHIFHEYIMIENKEIVNKTHKEVKKM